MATQTSIQTLIRHADPDFDKDRQKDLAYEFAGGKKKFYTGGDSGAAGYASNPPDGEG